MRHTTFRFGLHLTPAQEQLLLRHAGASRFAFNQCLQLVTERLQARRTDRSVVVPWFEEAAVDLGRALAAYEGSKSGERRGRPVGYPRSKKKGRCRDSFRLRNNTNGIRVGEGHPRSLRLPRIGTIRLHDDTRRLRRMLRPVTWIDPNTGEQTVAPRARILSATCNRRREPLVREPQHRGSRPAPTASSPATQG